jgi:hypothetical protein
LHGICMAWHLDGVQAPAPARMSQCCSSSRQGGWSTAVRARPGSTCWGTRGCISGRYQRVREVVRCSAVQCSAMHCMLRSSIPTMVMKARDGLMHSHTRRTRAHPTVGGVDDCDACCHGYHARALELMMFAIVLIPMPPQCQQLMPPHECHPMPI